MILRTTDGVEVAIPDDRIDVANIILPGEYNPHNVRLWVVTNVDSILGAVWGESEQDALDTLVDLGWGLGLLVGGEYISRLSEQELEQQQDGWVPLGNAGEYADLTYVGVIPLDHLDAATASWFLRQRDGTYGERMVDEDVIASYLNAALWSSDDIVAGAPFSEGFRVEDFTTAARTQARQDLESFFSENEESIEDILSVVTSLAVAHDFWLDRNGHGAGFLDHDYGRNARPAWRALHAAAQAFGEVNIVVGRNGGLDLVPWYVEPEPLGEPPPGVRGTRGLREGPTAAELEQRSRQLPQAPKPAPKIRIKRLKPGEMSARFKGLEMGEESDVLDRPRSTKRFKGLEPGLEDAPVVPRPSTKRFKGLLDNPKRRRNPIYKGRNRGVTWDFVTEWDPETKEMPWKVHAHGAPLWKEAIRVVSELLPEVILPILDKRVFFLMSMDLFDRYGSIQTAYYDPGGEPHMIALRELDLTPGSSEEKAILALVPTVIHELGHAIHFEWAGSKKDMAAYKLAFDKDDFGRREEKFSSPYAATSFYEDFAENVMHLVIGGQTASSYPAARLKVLGIDPNIFTENAKLGIMAEIRKERKAWYEEVARGVEAAQKRRRNRR